MGARRQIGEDFLRLGKGLFWGHFAAPPHSAKSLVLWTPSRVHLVKKQGKGQRPILGPVAYYFPDLIINATHKTS